MGNGGSDEAPASLIGALGSAGTQRGRRPGGGALVTKTEVAQLLKVSLRSVTNLMHDGTLPYLPLRGHIVRFRRADVERYLEEHSLVCNAPDRGPTARSILGI